MMGVELSDRILYMLLGAAIGFVLGYIVRSLRELKEELDEVDHVVLELKHDEEASKALKKDEDGFVRHPYVLDVALVVVIVITVWAAFASQRASNQLEETQERLEYVTACNQEFLSKSLTAAEQRTNFTQKQTSANVELQKAQTRFLRIILAPKDNDELERHAAEDYLQSLDEFVSVSKEVDEFEPYPKNDGLTDCLRHAERKAE